MSGVHAHRVVYPTVGLRPATAEDCDRVWTWNFAPDVRAVSSSPGEVSLDEHRRWYEARLALAGGTEGSASGYAGAARSARGGVAIAVTSSARLGAIPFARAAAAPMWIIEADGEPVGVIRIDPHPRSDPGGPGPLARISIALDPRARGRGLGRRAIATACRSWGAPVIAEIRADNTPSRLAFEAAGFACLDVPRPVIGGDRDLLTYQWRP